MKLECSRQIFEKFSNTWFHKNPSSGSRVVPCGRAEGRTDGQTGRQAGRQDGQHEVNSPFRNFANAPKNSVSSAFPVHQPRPLENQSLSLHSITGNTQSTALQGVCVQDGRTLTVCRRGLTLGASTGREDASTRMDTPLQDTWTSP
jgi:hypothetical protein